MEILSELRQIVKEKAKKEKWYGYAVFVEPHICPCPNCVRELTPEDCQIFTQIFTFEELMRLKEEESLMLLILRKTHIISRKPLCFQEIMEMGLSPHDSWEKVFSE